MKLQSEMRSVKKIIRDRQTSIRNSNYFMNGENNNDYIIKV